jgi:hypothetical protein
MRTIVPWTRVLDSPASGPFIELPSQILYRKQVMSGRLTSYQLLLSNHLVYTGEITGRPEGLSLISQLITYYTM